MLTKYRLCTPAICAAILYAAFISIFTLLTLLSTQNAAHAWDSRQTRTAEAEQAARQMQARDYNGALRLVNKSLEKCVFGSPQETDSLALRSRILLELGQFDEAVGDMAKAFEVYQSRNLCTPFLKTNVSAQAQICYYSKTIALAPKVFVFYEYRGRAYAASGDHVRAIADYKRAVALKSDSPNLHRAISYSYTSLGRVQDAIHEITLQMNRDTYDQDFVYRASLYKALGQNALAQQDMRDSRYARNTSLVAQRN